MGDYLGAPSSNDVPTDTTADIDTAGQQLARFMQLLLQHLLAQAARAATARRANAERAHRLAENAREEELARVAAERKVVELRLSKLREAGLGSANRIQLAQAVRDAAEWAPDSTVAAQSLTALREHLHGRFGLRLDAQTGEVIADLPAGVGQAIAAAEAEHATAERLATAQRRMVSVVAADASIDESAKPGLYAQIETWRANPTARNLDQLGKAFTAQGVREQTRTQVRFVATYLGTPTEVALDDLGAVAAADASRELARMPEPLVDLGEEAKPRVDDLLDSYRIRLQQGRDTTEITRRLTEEVAVMTPEDRKIAQDRGREIRDNPGAKFEPLWPEHVDREELAGTVRMYAVLAAQSERLAVDNASLDAPEVAAMERKATEHRDRITWVIKNGKGLHELERDQLRLVLAGIESGQTELPELLFADDRSAAAVDADRAAGIAHDTAAYNRRRLEQLLGQSSVPGAVPHRVADDVSKTFFAQTQLAAGHLDLTEYEQRRHEERLDTALTGGGVPQNVRNQVRNHLTESAQESATVGKQASRVAGRWAQRRELVAVGRAGEPGYGSAARLAAVADAATAAGMSPDEVAGHVAAEMGRAQPPTAAVGKGPGLNPRGRTTQPGAGVRRTHHRGRGRGGDQRGYGR